jgi:hypothetical protein
MSWKAKLSKLPQQGESARRTLKSSAFRSGSRQTGSEITSNFYPTENMTEFLIIWQPAGTCERLGRTIRNRLHLQAGSKSLKFKVVETTKDYFWCGHSERLRKDSNILLNSSLLNAAFQRGQFDIWISHNSWKCRRFLLPIVNLFHEWEKKIKLIWLATRYNSLNPVSSLWAWSSESTLWSDFLIS